jgi:hypothetical protein
MRDPPEGIGAVRVPWTDFNQACRSEAIRRVTASAAASSIHVMSRHALTTP